MIVVGLGNLLLCDEGVGVHVVTAMMERGLLEGMELVDGGVAGFSLINLIEGHEKVVIIDAVDAPLDAGTVIKLFPNEVGRKKEDRYSLHDLTIRDTLDLMIIMETMPDMLILGIVPEDMRTYKIGLSPHLEECFEEILEKAVKEIKRFSRLQLRGNS